MGSMQKLQPFQIASLYNGLANIPGCAVAWSLKEDQQKLLPDVSKVPDKFFVDKWFPQVEMIHLSDVAVVITHCGWGGLTETILAGKPIIATPFRADQPANAVKAKKLGLAKVLNVRRMTARSVEKTVLKVLNEPSFTQKAKELQTLAMKTAGATCCAEMIEEVAQHGSAWR